MECWSHGLDVVDVVDVERPDTDRLRHVVQLGLRTRPFSYANRGMTMPEAEIRLELTAPSGAACDVRAERGGGPGLAGRRATSARWSRNGGTWRIRS
jgi:hypothetical protein